MSEGSGRKVGKPRGRNGGRKKNDNGRKRPSGTPNDAVVIVATEILEIAEKYIKRNGWDYTATNAISLTNLRKQKYIGYASAERILIALGEELAFYDGRVTVIPNPNWSQERWMEWKEQQGCI